MYDFYFCDSCGNSADRFLVTILSRSSWAFRLPVEAASRKKFSKRDDVCLIPVQFSFYHAISDSVETKKLPNGTFEYLRQLSRQF